MQNLIAFRYKLPIPSNSLVFRANSKSPWGMNLCFGSISKVLLSEVSHLVSYSIHWRRSCTIQLSLCSTTNAKLFLRNVDHRHEQEQLMNTPVWVSDPHITQQSRDDLYQKDHKNLDHCYSNLTQGKSIICAEPATQHPQIWWGQNTSEICGK